MKKTNYIYVVEITEFDRNTFVSKFYCKPFKTMESALKYAKSELILAEYNEKIIKQDFAKFYVYFDQNFYWRHQVITINKIKKRGIKNAQ